MRRRTILAAPLLALPIASVAPPARAQGLRLLDLLAGTTLGANRFVELATVNSNFEIQSSELILSRSTHPQIRDFARRMVEQHRAMLAALEAMPEASTRTPAALDESATGRLILLRNQGEEDLLNRYYVQQQIEAHEEAVEVFEAYGADGEVDSLKQFAQRRLPMLREHLAAARALQAPRAG